MLLSLSSPFFRVCSVVAVPGENNGAIERSQRLQQQKRLQGKTGFRAVWEGVPEGENTEYLSSLIEKYAKSVDALTHTQESLHKVPWSAPGAILSRMQLPLHATRQSLS